MNWTKNSPTEPGWYWFREDMSRSAVIHKVGKWPGGGLAVVLSKRWHDHEVSAPENMSGHWYGPLQEPGGDAVENCLPAFSASDSLK